VTEYCNHNVDTIDCQGNVTLLAALPAVAITWPQSTNGNLNSIKLGSTLVYNTPKDGGSLTRVSCWARRPSEPSRPVPAKT
jgi:hypothetical protein